MIRRPIIIDLDRIKAAVKWAVSFSVSLALAALLWHVFYLSVVSIDDAIEHKMEEDNGSLGRFLQQPDAQMGGVVGHSRYRGDSIVSDNSVLSFVGGMNVEKQTNRVP